MKHIFTLVRCKSFLFSLLCLFTATNLLHAQWTNTGGPPSRLIQCFSVMDSTILGGTDGGLVRSTNNGTSWVNVGSGMSYSNVRALLSVAAYPFNLLAGTINGGTF